MTNISHSLSLIDEDTRSVWSDEGPVNFISSKFIVFMEDYLQKWNIIFTTMFQLSSPDIKKNMFFLPSFTSTLDLLPQRRSPEQTGMFSPAHPLVSFLKVVLIFTKVNYLICAVSKQAVNDDKYMLTPTTKTLEEVACKLLSEGIR